jgi:hypothetical protein
MPTTTTTATSTNTNGGDGLHAARTYDGRVTAVNTFNKLSRAYNEDPTLDETSILPFLPKAENLTREFLKTLHEGKVGVHEVFEAFARFLLGKNCTTGGEKHWAPDTQTSYFTCFKNWLANRAQLKSMAFWKDDTWHQIMFKFLERRGRAEAIKRGEPIAAQQLAIHRSTAKNMAQYLMEQNTGTHEMYRCIINTIRLAAGRSGEVEVTTWDSLVFNHARYVP